MTTRRRLVGVAVATTLGVSLLAAAAATGASAATSGWWTSAPGQPAPLNTVTNPAAPGPGQLGVAATAAGAVSVAAVRFQLGDGEVPTSLLLTIASGAGQQVAIVVACPSARAWSPAAGGPMTDAPAAACGSRQAVAQPSAESTLRFTLDAGFASGGVVDLVIAPGATDAGGQKVTPAFSLVLTAPTAAALTTTRAAVSTPEDFGGAPTAASPAVIDDPTLGLSSPTNFGLGAEPPPQVFPLTPDPPVGVGPVVAPAPGVALGPTRRTVKKADTDKDDRARALGLLLFPLAFLGGIWALNASTPTLLGIGRLAHHEEPAEHTGEGGLARFRRQRTEPPVPLR